MVFRVLSCTAESHYKICKKSGTKYVFKELTLHKNSRIKLKAEKCNESSAEIRQNDDDSLDLVTSLCTVKSGPTTGASWTTPNFNGCPGSGTTPTPTLQPTPIDDDEIKKELDEIKNDMLKDPEKGAEAIKEITDKVEGFSPNATENFAEMLGEIIDSMPKPISAATSTLLMDSMINMLRKVF